MTHVGYPQEERAQEYLPHVKAALSKIGFACEPDGRLPENSASIRYVITGKAGPHSKRLLEIRGSFYATILADRQRSNQNKIDAITEKLRSATWSAGPIVIE